MCLTLKCEVCGNKLDISYSDKRIELVQKRENNTPDGIYKSWEFKIDCPECKQPIHWFDSN